MPAGLRQLETMLFSIGRITQMLEMNFEVLAFIGSLTALIERVRQHVQRRSTALIYCHAAGRSFRQATSTVREARSTSADTRSSRYHSSRCASHCSRAHCDAKGYDSLGYAAAAGGAATLALVRIGDRTP